MPRRIPIATSLALLLVVAAPPARAQYPTTATTQQATDTGQDGVTPTGGFPVTIPIELPPSRGGLPLPLRVAPGRAGGADVALSYVLRTSSIAHRKPRHSAGGTLAGREQVTLALLGQRHDMVPRGANEWVVRDAMPGAVLRLQSDGSWLLDDGAGATYRFVRHASLPASFPIALLTTITGQGAGNRVELTHDVLAHDVLGTASERLHAYSIRLTRLTYNLHPTTAGCAKNIVDLVYQTQAAPLDLSFVDGTALARMHTLTDVKVQGLGSCGGSPQLLSRTELLYSADPDTGLPQVSSVQRYGRTGKPDATPPIVVASYTRGVATSGASLAFRRAGDIAAPAATTGLTGVELTYDLNAPGSRGPTMVTRQALIDMTCDGRPDFVYEDAAGRLQIADNRPGPGGTTTFGAPHTLEAGTPQLPPGPLAMVHKRTYWPKLYLDPDGTGSEPDVDWDEWPEGESLPDEPAPDLALFPGPAHVIENEWRRVMDWNGDGCLDIVHADEEAQTWVVYLNRYGVSGEGGFVRVALDVSGPWRTLVARYGWDLDYVPLSSRITTNELVITDCLRLVSGGTWVQDECGSGNYFPRDQDPAFDEHGLRTVTRFELQDLNGDGYPDFLLTLQPAEKIVEPLEVPGGTTYVGPTLHRVGFRVPSAEVQVMYNDAGARIFDGVIPFAAPQRLFDRPQGIALWAETPSFRHQAVAELIDVDGDGLLDRVDSTSVSLQDGAGGFRRAYDLPTSIETGAGLNKLWCQDGAETYDTFQSSGLHDFTGDGRPDFYFGASYGFKGEVSGGTIAVATGTGFPAAQQRSITMTGVVPSPFRLQHDLHDCDGRNTTTHDAAVDLDGDGVAEIVRRPPGAASLEVYYLSAPSDPARLGAPDAGRIVTVESGAGARTTIGYENAKRDGSTHHSVPFPEIVVTSVATSGARGLGGTTATRRFAYGSAFLHFDPAEERYVFPGYLRRVEVTLARPGGDAGTFDGTATIVDGYPLEEFTPSMDATARWARYARVGRPRETFYLAGNFTADPWGLLGGTPRFDGRLIGSTFATFAARELDGTRQASYAELDCLDWVAPLDPELTLANVVVGPSATFCGQTGFTYLDMSQSWRGRLAPPDTANVETRTHVLEVDDLGRTRSVWQENDVHVPDDDLCVLTTYAESILAAGTGRNLGAVASREVTRCAKLANQRLARETYQYDLLPQGSVGAGRLTSSTVERLATDDGSTLAPPLRVFDAKYDASGNRTQLKRTRGDGAVQTTTWAYDAFALAPTTITRTATGLATQKATIKLDPNTLEVLSVTDPNLSVWGTTYDAFGRVLTTTLTPPGGTLGVLSKTKYEGFIGTDPLGRRVTTRELADPAPVAGADTAPAQSRTVYLDELGRERRVEAVLGSPYSSGKLVTDTSYDSLGRESFVSDPYGDAEAKPYYGTSYHFNADGTPRCSIRGRGPQPLVLSTDEAQELYPTCYAYSFSNHQAVTEESLPDALLAGSPQAGVKRVLVQTAIGRLLSDSTWKGTTRLEHATHGYDGLGNLVAYDRYQNAAAGSDAVTTRQRWDSLGRPIEYTSHGAPRQRTTYDDWSNVTEVRFADAGGVHTVVASYDALGRVTRSYEATEGVIDPETDASFTYDSAVAVTPAAPGAPVVAARNLVGRLSRATWSTGAEYLSYDATGGVEATTFTDGAGFVAVQKVDAHPDGRPAAIRLYLPDDGYQEERIDYGYDGAARLRSVTYQGAKPKRVYEAAVIDAQGRVREARQNDGAQLLQTDYQPAGRRLPKSVKWVGGQDDRTIDFGGFDPLGRERTRSEKGAAMGHSYDALGRIASTTRTAGGTMVTSTFSYDPLGNLRLRAEANLSTDVAMSFLSGAGEDRDRLCRISYGDGPVTAAPCNVVHDAMGDVVQQPTRAGGTRTFEYTPSGRVRRIVDGGTVARLRYDAYGALQALDVDAARDARADRRYGSLIESRNGVLWRHIPGDGGIVGTYRGAGGGWTFPFADGRGTRFVSDDKDVAVQDVRYEAFGEATSSGSEPGDADYTSQQWNDGDALEAFGCLVQVGARLYDPCIGRFLSRDPLFIPRTAATSNPYAFAMNDPVNGADRSGLDPSCGADDLCITKSMFEDELHLAESIGEAWAIHDFFLGQDGQYEFDDSVLSRATFDSYEEKLATLGYHNRVANHGTAMLESLLYVHLYPPLRGFCDVIACDQETGGGDTFVPDGKGGYKPDNYRRKTISYGEQALNVALTVLMRGRGGAGRRVARSAEREAAAAEKACVGGLCEADETCFTAGTPVATASGMVAIETVRPGGRVASLDAASCTEPVDPASCREIEIAQEDPYGYEDQLTARFLRSEAWVRANGAEPGAEVPLALAELGIRGRGRIVSVGACSIQGGAGCLVSGTVTHKNRSVLRLHFEGSATTIEPTALHQLWSVSRGGWVRAGELAVGERLLTEEGTVTIAAIERLPGARQVFNFEVAGAHTYMVSELRIKSHNTSCDLGRGPGPYMEEIANARAGGDMMGYLTNHPLTEWVRMVRPNGRAALFLDGHFPPQGVGDGPYAEAFRYIRYEAKRMLRDGSVLPEERPYFRQLLKGFSREEWFGGPVNGD